LPSTSEYASMTGLILSWRNMRLRSVFLLP